MGKQGARLRLTDEDRTDLCGLLDEKISRTDDLARKLRLVKLRDRIMTPRAGHPPADSLERLSDLAYGNSLLPKEKKVRAAWPTNTRPQAPASGVQSSTSERQRSG